MDHNILCTIHHTSARVNNIGRKNNKIKLSAVIIATFVFLIQKIEDEIKQAYQSMKCTKILATKNFGRQFRRRKRALHHEQTYLQTKH